jgi:hypothetical protein
VAVIGAVAVVVVALIGAVAVVAVVAMIGAVAVVAVAVIGAVTVVAVGWPRAAAYEHVVIRMIAPGALVLTRPHTPP